MSQEFTQSQDDVEEPSEVHSAVIEIFDDLVQRTGTKLYRGQRSKFLSYIGDTFDRIVDEMQCRYSEEGDAYDEARRRLGIAADMIADHWDEVAAKCPQARGTPPKPGAGALCNRGIIVAALQVYEGLQGEDIFEQMESEDFGISWETLQATYDSQYT